MKQEYDFSDGVRGKFYHPEIQEVIPIYLDSDAYSFVAKIARNKNEDISDVVNELIMADKQIADMIQ